MRKQILFLSALAVQGLTACEKELEVGVEVFPTEQVKNSLLQVRTRSGGSNDETTVAYPVTVYVFAGNECRATQTIGDEEQTLNIPQVGDTYLGCYVLSVTDTDTDVDVLLLSPDETSSLATETYVANALEYCGAADVDWPIPFTRKNRTFIISRRTQGWNWIS
jgi:hypothetical protein